MRNGPLWVLRAIFRIAGLLWLAGGLAVSVTPIYGYRGAPSQSVQRAFTQDICPGNLLINPSFEAGSRKTEGMGTSLSSSVAHGWFPWFIGGDQRFNREPEFKVEDATRDPLRWRVHSGYFSQKFFTTWATHTAGIYQRVPVPPGSVVTFSIWVQIYTGEADGWDGEKHHSDPDAPGNYRALIGIDPLGGVSPGPGAPPPDTVIWTQPIMTYDVWTQLSVQAVAQADHVTVYTRGQPEFSVKHNDSFWDTGCLTVGGVVIGVSFPANADAVVDTAALNFRAGPGTEYDIIDTLRRGDPLTVEARLADNSWLNVRDNAGTVGWVFANLVRLGIDLEEVPVALEVPPTPTPAPTDTPVPSLTPAPTASSVSTDTPVPTATPEPTQTPSPAPTATVTITPVVVARAEESSPAVGEGTVPASPDSSAVSPPARSQSSRGSYAPNCVPGLIALGVGLLGLLIWPRQRRFRD